MRADSAVCSFAISRTGSAVAFPFLDGFGSVAVRLRLTPPPLDLRLDLRVQFVSREPDLVAPDATIASLPRPTSPSL